MKFNRVLLGSAIALATFGGQGAYAAGGTTLSDVLTNSGITANGWLSGSYVYGFNGGSDLGGRTFDGDGDSFVFNQGVLNVSSLPTDGFGGMITLLAGDDAQIVSGSYGDGDHKFVVNQAYVQYASGALTVIGGRYNTLAGAEVIADPLNANLSRSLLFTFAEPFVHTGVRASWKFSDVVTGYLGVNNSGLSGAASDNDQRKTIELGAYITPTSAIGLGIYDYYGTEEYDAGGHFKNNYLDFVGTFQATPQLQLVLNADYQKFFVDGTSDDPSRYGVAGYVNFKLSDLFRVSGRVEYLKFDYDTDGATNDRLMSYTVTFGYSPAKNFDILAEARLDDSKEKGGIIGLYPDGTRSDGDGGTVQKFDDSQPDVAIKAIYKFGL